MEFQSTELAELYDYWSRIRGARTMPAREDIDPSQIRHLLPLLFMVDVADEIADCRFRLFGTALTIAYGADLTGRTLGDIFLGRERDAIFDKYREAIATGAPVASQHKFRSSRGELVHFERLLLPLSDDPPKVSMLLGGTRLFTPNFGTWGA